MPPLPPMPLRAAEPSCCISRGSRGTQHIARVAPLNIAPYKGFNQPRVVAVTEDDDIVDALRAGCILIGSPVGCYPEMVRDGQDGFLIPGDAGDEETQQRAAAAHVGSGAPGPDLRAELVRWLGERGLPA